MKSATAFYLLPSLSLTPLPLAGSFSVSANSFCPDFMGEINWKERTLGASQGGIPMPTLDQVVFEDDLGAEGCFTCFFIS